MNTKSKKTEKRKIIEKIVGRELTNEEYKLAKELYKLDILA